MVWNVANPGAVMAFVACTLVLEIIMAAVVIGGVASIIECAYYTICDRCKA